MSVVANCDPLFQLWKSWTVPDADNRKMAETMDPSGLYPSAASSAAFSTQKAASTGVNRATTTFETKPLKLVCKLATRSEEHTSELQSLRHLVCRLLLEK